MEKKKKKNQSFFFTLLYEYLSSFMFKYIFLKVSLAASTVSSNCVVQRNYIRLEEIDTVKKNNGKDVHLKQSLTPTSMEGRTKRHSKCGKMWFFTELTCPSLFQGIPLVNKLKKSTIHA